MQTATVFCSEPYQVSPRFRNAIVSAIAAHESNAASDERALVAISHPDHRRRQQLLVDRQLDRAFRLRELLARTVLRPERA